MVRVIIGATLMLFYFLILLSVFATPGRNAKDEATRAQFPLAGGVLILLPGLALGAWGYYSLSKRSSAKSQKVKAPALNPRVACLHAPSAKSQKVEVLAQNPPLELPNALSAKPAAAGGWTASSVLVIGKAKVVDAAYKQAEDRVLRTVAAKPSIPVKADVSVTTLQGEELPASTRSALQGAVWSLQRRFQLDTGTLWHVDFYNQAGFTFMVVYLP